jgi:hypothetical protein
VAVIRGGDRVDAYMANIARRIKRSGTLRVGFLEGATYPDGTPVAMVAAIQNFGAPAMGIPPRPFFSNMIAEKSANWGPQLARILHNNGNDVDKSLELMGLGIGGQLVQAINDMNDPPLAPATIAGKGFEKPLIDTGHMRQSVDYEIEGAG